MRRGGALVVPLTAVALVAVVCAAHADDLGNALGNVPIWAFAASALAHLIVLFFRTEAWRVTLAGIGRVPSRRISHWASSVGFLVGILEGHAALPARMALARRLAPDATPPLREMLLTDVPVYALETCLLALLIPVVIVSGIGLPLWSAAVALVAAPAAVLGLRMLHKRYASHRLAAGLAVLAQPRLRRQLFVLGAIVVGLTFVRIWLILWAVELPAGVGDAAVTYVAVTVVGQLPLGPATGPAATLAVASGSGVAGAAAGGLVISASGISGVLAYLALSGLLTTRKRREKVTV